ncbi:MAG: hypothetical protein BRC57_10660 [Cyanobacteria bacterium QS_8_48_54]|jgi:hypothetical protein|nr:MAG: hypothetical protein BRC57_10660 [Cyanobacteria bacterium QS_8_48_54]
MITFVTFHIDTKRDTANKITHLGRKIGRWKHDRFRNDYNYTGLLDLLFRSAEIFHPNCGKVILTNEQTDLSGLTVDFARYNYEIASDSLMRDRLSAQLDYLASDRSTSNLVFVDSDMLINQNLDVIFEAQYSLGLTYDPNPNLSDMPINGGLFFIPFDRKDSAYAFLKKASAIYDGKLSDFAAWWGDQYALIQTIGPASFQNRSSEQLNQDGVEIALFSCEYYNFKPPNHVTAVAVRFRDKAIFHFNGNRKRFMPLFWETHLAPKEQQTLTSYYRSTRNRVLLGFSKSHSATAAFLRDKLSRIGGFLHALIR